MTKKVGLAVVLVALVAGGAIYALASLSNPVTASAAALELSVPAQGTQPGSVCADKCGHAPGSAECQEAHESGQCQGHAPGNGGNGDGSGDGCGGHGPKGGCKGKGHGGGGSS